MPGRPSPFAKTRNADYPQNQIWRVWWSNHGDVGPLPACLRTATGQSIACQFNRTQRGAVGRQPRVTVNSRNFSLLGESEIGRAPRPRLALRHNCLTCRRGVMQQPVSEIDQGRCQYDEDEIENDYAALCSRKDAYNDGQILRFGRWQSNRRVSSS